MSYREEIQDKIQSPDERTKERTRLWQEVGAAYNHGGVEQVSSMLAKKIEGLKYQFEKAIGKLQETL